MEEWEGVDRDTTTKTCLFIPYGIRGGGCFLHTSSAPNNIWNISSMMMEGKKSREGWGQRKRLWWKSSTFKNLVETNTCGS